MPDLRFLPALLALALGFPPHAAGAGKDGDLLLKGAENFIERCVLCHGNLGMGDGLLPATLEGYPSTNLFGKKRVVTEESVARYLETYNAERHPYSPPWLQELSRAQIMQLTAFTALLVTDRDTATPLLKKAENTAEVEVSVNRGDVIFRTRCAVCHGKKGKGDGMLAAVVKNPPPFNLTLSRAPDEYLFRIIKLGGGEMGRSPSMPAWGGDLTDFDIRSLILKLKTLRTKP